LVGEALIGNPDPPTQPPLPCTQRHGGAGCETSSAPRTFSQSLPPEKLLHPQGDPRIVPLL
jgi:hypothetical protein